MDFLYKPSLRVRRRRSVRLAFLPNKVMFMTCCTSSGWSGTHEKAPDPPAASLSFQASVIIAFSFLSVLLFLIPPRTPRLPLLFSPMTQHIVNFQLISVAITSLSPMFLCIFSMTGLISSKTTSTDVNSLSSLVLLLFTPPSSVVLCLIGVACDSWEVSRVRPGRTSWMLKCSVAWRTAWPLRPTREGFAAWSRRS